MSMDLYREVILDHYKHPRNFGSLPHPTATAHEYNATCGDRIVMEIVVNAQHVVKDIRFSGEGCAISMASASMITEKVKGMKKEEIIAMNTDTIVSMLGTTLTPSRVKCAVLPLEVVQKCFVVGRK